MHQITLNYEAKRKKGESHDFKQTFSIKSDGCIFTGQADLYRFMLILKDVKNEYTCAIRVLFKQKQFRSLIPAF